MSYRVWHLISNRWYSAISEYALRSVISLDNHGCENLLSPLAAKPLHSKALKEGIKTSCVESFSPMPTTLRWLYQTAKQFNPDIIVAYGGPETFLLRLLPKKDRSFIRFRGKNEDVLASSPSVFAHNHLDGILTPARVVAERFQGLKKPIHTVALGLDTKRFYPHNISKLQRPTLRIIGRLDPIKGHGSFLSIFRQMLDHWHYPTARPFLEIIGEPANITADEIKRIASQLGLSHGKDYGLIDCRVSGIAALMSSAHLGVISSLGSEVICRVAEEFLLCGTPIIISGVGALGECLINANAGISYANYHGQYLAQKLNAKLLEAYHEPFEHKRKRSEEAKKLFSYEAMGIGLVRMFDDIRA